MSNKNILLIGCLFLLFYLNGINSHAQAILEANGPGKTYELINSVFAPGFVAVEAPDQCTSHPAFGRHVAEIWDSTLNKYVFEFYIHVPTSFPVTDFTADNDRCMNYDRQRVEIKTYESSPDSIKGIIGNTMTFKWKFRLPLGFQPSPNFTHIHQVKAVGGDDGDPIFTLTVRYGNPNMLELNYVKDSGTSVNKLKSIKLSSIIGEWIEASEKVTVGANGNYSITLKKVSTGKVILSDTTNNIPTIRPSNNFIRPKWGIYRSLLNPSYLRDESIRMASYLIYKGSSPDSPTIIKTNPVSVSKINISWKDTFSRIDNIVIERSLNGINGWIPIATVSGQTKNYIDSGLAANTVYYYRIMATNLAGNSPYSNVVFDTTLTVVSINTINFKAIDSSSILHVQWSVDKEDNLHHYVLQYSANGMDYNDMYNVAATNKSVYYYQQSMLSDNEQYYRIKFVKTNGSFFYSNTILLFTDVQMNLSIYPNPAKGNINISVNMVKPNMYLYITDMVGRVINKVPLNNLSTTLTTSNLSNGRYNIQLLQNNQIIKNYPLLIIK